MATGARITAFVFLFSFGLSGASCESRTTKLRREGDRLIHLIDQYRLQTGKLPASLAALGVAETEAGPLYYQRKDTTTYEVWFGTSLGESETYSSQTKKWGNEVIATPFHCP
jgi:hypothetical protein